MKVKAYHYLVAYTLQFSMCLGAAGAVVLLLLALHDEGILVANLGVWVWIILASIPAGLIGLILGTIFIWGVFLARVAARIQGWPFKAGDEVVILTGKHKNTQAKIYEIWGERGQVRVDLGDNLKQAVKDVFCAVEVCRITPQNKSSDATSEPAPGAGSSSHQG